MRGGRDLLRLARPHRLMPGSAWLLSVHCRASASRVLPANESHARRLQPFPAQAVAAATAGVRAARSGRRCQVLSPSAGGVPDECSRKLRSLAPKAPASPPCTTRTVPSALPSVT